MKTVSNSTGERRQFSELVAFLHGCREEAAKAGSYRIANISLRVGRIDALAVLESILEPDELHFYLERSVREEALAGADGVVEFTTDGPGRFVEAKGFMEDVLARSICIGDMDAPYSGPHFFCSFSFFDRPGLDSPFPGVTVFVPRWQVGRRGNEYTAAANLRIDPDTVIEPLAEKVWRAHGRFSSFDYRKTASLSSSGERRGEAVPTPENGARGRFESAVGEALGLIREQRLKKVVLARYLDVKMPGGLNPLHALNRLRMAHPNCFTYSVANGKGQSMIGASPERLLRRKGTLLETEALAGSAPRGMTASEDAELAEGLLRSIKDNWEHRLVIDSIRRRLAILPINCDVLPQPDLLQLANVQHLRTGIEGVIPSGIHLLDILAELHPTPAVGGTPRTEACATIRRLEGFSRGLYAGAIGWVDSRGEGEFTVAIRSTLIEGVNARVFAGAGIVEGSVPSREWNETEVKLRAVLEVLT